MNPMLNRILLRCKPSVPLHYLFFIASFVWAFAGTMLLIRGLIPVLNSTHALLSLCIATPAGILFYLLMFSRISAKHIFRIRNIQVYHPCAFSFFDWKSYGMMLIMITAGIGLKKINLVPHNYYYPFLVCMGIPLVISALRFFRAGMLHRKQNRNHG